MLARHSQPIAAIATAAGRAAVGIVRLSGQGLLPLATALLGAEPRPRLARYGPFLAADGQAIDNGLALWFPAPHSYTGEDVLELQAHGGPVLLQWLLSRCLEAAAEMPAGAESPRLPGLRPADPGEFTQRAFLNGKLDLAQAEAVADLIDAGTQAAARSAGASLSGAFSREVDTVRLGLERLRVLVEATLDFPEEEVDVLQQADALGQVQRAGAAVAAVQARARQGVLLRDGMQVVLAGQPNVGKSALLNALAGAELAIVTPVAGTTRDKVAQTIQIDGVPLHLVDTAGLRDSDDTVERIGIQRSWQALAQADAVLFLHDLSRRGEPAYDQAEADIARRLGLGGTQSPGPRVLHVFNKCDLLDDRAISKPLQPALPDGALVLSAQTGAGLPALRAALLQQVGWQALPEGVFTARARHVDALRRTAAALTDAQTQLQRSPVALELCAESLRQAHEALGEITGAVSADDLLGQIFGSFCIGK